MLSTRELAALTKSVATVIREHVAKLFAPIEKEQEALAEELQALRALLNGLPAPKDGKDGTDGKSVTVEEILALIPPPKDGIDGKSVTIGDVLPVVKDWFDTLPRPKDGIDGKSVTVEEILALMPPPKDGIDGIDGKSVTVDELLPTVKAWFDALPRPRDGVDGKSVTVDELLPTVKAWFDALPRPRDGADGKSVTVEDIGGIIETQLAKWALDFERRAQDTLQRCVDRIAKPRDGKDGADGVGFDDLTVEQDGPRTFKFRFVRGERTKEFSFSLPVVLDCGVYVVGKQYAAGDSVSFGGSLWIAQKDSPGKPGDVDSGWRLAVKKGRDGRDREVPAAS